MDGWITDPARPTAEAVARSSIDDVLSCYTSLQILEGPELLMYVQEPIMGDHIFCPFE